MLNDSQRLLVVKYSWIAEVVASQVFRNYKGPLQLDDLLSIGNEALIDAVLEYDPARGASYKTYLFFKVQKLILDQLRENQLLSRRYMRYYTSFKNARNSLEQKLYREPFFEEIAEFMGISIGRIIFIQAKAKQLDYILIDSDYPVKLPRQLTPVEELINEEASMILKESISCLQPRTRAVIAFHYYGGLHGYEIADILGISEGRVSQIKRRGLKFIKERMLTLCRGEYES